MSFKRTLSSSFAVALAVVGLTSHLQAVALNLSEAEGHNLVVWGNASLYNSDIQGSAAVGGNAGFGGYSIGESLASGQPSQAAFVVGGNLNAGDGQVYKGSIYVGGSYSGPAYPLNSAPGSVNQSGMGKANVPFNFGTAQTALTQKSATYGAAAANGTVSVEWGSTYTLTGTNTALNIFSLTAAQLASSTSLVINAPIGSQVLINVAGQAINFSGGISGTFNSPTNILYNFYQATNVFLTSIGVKGSILAPLADVNFQYGHQDGQLIAKSFTGMGELHHFRFNNQTEDTSNRVPDAGSSLLLLAGGLLALYVGARRQLARTKG